MSATATRIQRRLRNKQADWVFSAKDFLDFGSRAAVDQALSRLAKTGTVRRIARGLYDRPRHNALLNTAAPATLAAVVDAVARRDDVVVVSDGSVDANQLGLSTAVPSRALYWTTGPSRTLRVGPRSVKLKKMPSWLRYWTGRPAAPIVKAMQWLGPTLTNDHTLTTHLQRQLTASVAKDLRRNIAHLPGWMHASVKSLVIPAINA